MFLLYNNVMYKVAQALEGWRICPDSLLPTVSGRLKQDQLGFIQKCVSKQRSADAELWAMLSKGTWFYSNQLQTGEGQSVQEIEWLQ